MFIEESSLFSLLTAHTQTAGTAISITLLKILIFDQNIALCRKRCKIWPYTYKLSKNISNGTIKTLRRGLAVTLEVE